MRRLPVGCPGQRGGNGGTGEVRWGRSWSARWAEGSSRVREGRETPPRGAGEASGWAAGRRSPSPARLRRRSCSSPWRGRRSPEAAPGAQLRPGAPRHASRRAPWEGAGLAPHDSAAAGGGGSGGGTQEAARLGEGADHIPGGGGSGGGCAARFLLRSCHRSCSPQRKGRAAAAAAPSPCPPPPAFPRPVPLPLPLPGRRLSAPRASPIRLPPPVQRRGRSGGCGQN